MPKVVVQIDSNVTGYNYEGDLKLIYEAEVEYTNEGSILSYDLFDYFGHRIFVPDYEVMVWLGRKVAASFNEYFDYMNRRVG